MQINHTNYFNQTLRDVKADSRAIAEINGRMLQLSNRGSESGGIEEQTQEVANKVFQLQQTIERDLIFSQDSGFAFDVEVSDESVHITSKILMRIDTKEDEKFSAHFAVKTEITIPREELCRENIGGEENPFPGLAVKEILSTLIVNNPSEAREVLQKL